MKIQRLRLAAQLALFILAFSYFQHASAAGDEPMQVEFRYSGGNCESCEWINASGVITANSAKRLEALILERASKYYGGKPYCGLVALNSHGGNLVGGLELGRTLRKFGCTTIVARTEPEPADSSVDALMPGDCHSSCAYAFLGGAHRRVLEGSRYGIHQHYRSDAISTPDLKTLSAVDLSHSQILTGLIVAYVIEMGVDPSLVSVASLVPPNTDIFVLNRERLERYKVVTDTPPPVDPWILKPLGKGLVAQVTQVQNDFGDTQRARLLCESTDSSRRLMEFIVPITPQQEVAVRSVLEGPQPAMVLKTDRSEPIYVNAYTGHFVGLSSDRFMILRFQVDSNILHELRRGNILEWERDPARWSWGLFKGYFSLRESAVSLPFAFDHCL